MYWSNVLQGVIRRSTLDGTNVELLADLNVTTPGKQNDTICYSPQITILCVQYSHYYSHYVRH